LGVRLGDISQRAKIGRNVSVFNRQKKKGLKKKQCPDQTNKQKQKETMSTISIAKEEVSPKEITAGLSL
jgi:hypothetical protein